MRHPGAPAGAATGTEVPGGGRIGRMSLHADDDVQYRIEHDTMGEVRVPADALYRAQTQRAVENFPISGTGLERGHVAALARVKKAAALADAGQMSLF